MKTKIIPESQNDYAKQKNKDFETQYLRSMLLALLEDKKITKAQYEECKRKLKLY